MMFGRQGPSPAFAAEEQQRGDNLAARIVQIQADPGSAQNDVLPLFKAAAQNAYGNAATHSPQPGGCGMNTTIPAELAADVTRAREVLAATEHIDYDNPTDAGSAVGTLQGVVENLLNHLPTGSPR